MLTISFFLSLIIVFSLIWCLVKMLHLLKSYHSTEFFKEHQFLRTSRYIKHLNLSHFYVSFQVILYEREATVVLIINEI